MSTDPIRILVLCTGNSCRSILAEALINHLGAGRFEAHSAGSQPTGTVNPHALAKLEREGLRTAGLRSKSWDEFTGETAPALDIVITVCDRAAGESCPVWHGSPVRAHWGIPDPAGASGAAIEPAFDEAFDSLKRRIDMLCELPLEDFDERQTRDALLRIHDALTPRPATA